MSQYSYTWGRFYWARPQSRFLVKFELNCQIFGDLATDCINLRSLVKRLKSTSDVCLLRDSKKVSKRSFNFFLKQLCAHLYNKRKQGDFVKALRKLWNSKNLFCFYSTVHSFTTFLWETNPKAKPSLFTTHLKCNIILCIKKKTFYKQNDG